MKIFLPLRLCGYTYSFLLSRVSHIPLLSSHNHLIYYRGGEHESQKMSYPNYSRTLLQGYQVWLRCFVGAFVLKCFPSQWNQQWLCLNPFTHF